MPLLSQIMKIFWRTKTVVNKEDNKGYISFPRVENVLDAEYKNLMIDLGKIFPKMSSISTIMEFYYLLPNERELLTSYNKP